MSLDNEASWLDNEESLWAVMGVLARSATGLTLDAIVAETGLSDEEVQQQLDELEAKGILNKVACAADAATA